MIGWTFSDPLFQGLLFYPAVGAPQIVATHAGGGAIDASGDIVVVPLSDEQPLELARWRCGRVRTFAKAETPLGGGARLIYGGLLGPRCLAEDGRAATFSDFTDGQSALLCVDRRGAHVAAALDGLAPADNAFAYVRQCGLADGELLFASFGSVYRASEEDIRRVAGPGDVTDTGRAIAFIERYVAGFRDQYFAINRGGTVVLLAGDGADEIVLLRQRTVARWKRSRST